MHHVTLWVLWKLNAWKDFKVYVLCSKTRHKYVDHNLPASCHLPFFLLHPLNCRLCEKDVTTTCILKLLPVLSLTYLGTAENNIIAMPSILVLHLRHCQVSMKFCSWTCGLLKRVCLEHHILLRMRKFSWWALSSNDVYSCVTLSSRTLMCSVKHWSGSCLVWMRPPLLPHLTLAELLAFLTDLIGTSVYFFPPFAWNDSTLVEAVSVELFTHL